MQCFVNKKKTCYDHKVGKMLPNCGKDKLHLISVVNKAICQMISLNPILKLFLAQIIVDGCIQEPIPKNYLK